MYFVVVLTTSFKTPTCPCRCLTAHLTIDK